MFIMGLDLSGPSNHKDTSLAICTNEEGTLQVMELLEGVSDVTILERVEYYSRLGEVAIGIDSPLSYEDGGGDRPSDRALRQFIVSIGMKSGSIMPPTMNRMVYLTLRGIRLTREIEANFTGVKIAEVHPGAILGARIVHDSQWLDHILNYKSEPRRLGELLDWLEDQGLQHIPRGRVTTSHCFDALVAAFGAWHWADPSLGPAWLFPKELPLHPYDFCC
ncbi:hypothetical protein Q73_14410 [Bacillus coahuilensis m2-6]|uniref:DUF429 domain-containing protein n=1 Tax=Bacillus coahuilensis TaxID=408580 RepID=UPI000750120F|nr:DUF429 domain-containing protein [Bacillus coahuilensis]KUP04823.1 hypothetical protein Q73_14410 [Bacillus coahuilensis m2-6]